MQFLRKTTGIYFEEVSFSFLVSNFGSELARINHYKEVISSPIFTKDISEFVGQLCY